ncbi:MAG: lipid-A-disaccharide synthase, partial [Serratia marcescens]|nr:lipid-A-disaccharide synthase [Serratia marcescens]
PFTFWLAQKLAKTPYVSLPNLLAGREIVTELLQHDCVPDKLAAAVMPLLEESPETDALKHTFLTLHQSIRCGADEQAAQAVLELAKA